MVANLGRNKTATTIRSMLGGVEALVVRRGGTRSNKGSVKVEGMMVYRRRRFTKSSVQVGGVEVTVV